MRGPIRKISFLLLISLSSFAQTTVREAVGINGHGQEDQPTLSYLAMTDEEGAPDRPKKVGLRRWYCLQYMFSPTDEDWGKLFLSVTVQGFNFKDKIQQLRDRGIGLIWTTTGAFKYQSNYTVHPPSGVPMYTAKDNAGGLMPINVEDDPYNPASYSETVKYVKNVALIYGRTPHAEGLDSAEHKVFWGGRGTLFTGGPLNNGTGLGGVDIIELQNEAFLTKSYAPYGKPGDLGGIVVWDYRSYAIFFKACYDAIKKADPTMKVKVGGFWDDGRLKDYHGIQAAYFKEYGTHLPKDVILGFHNYPYKGSSGVIPESNAKECDSWYNGKRGLLDNNKAWDALGYDWQLGEFGWDESINSDRSVVQISGYTREQSVGILDTRMMLLTLTAKRCKAVIHYRLVNQSKIPETSKLRFASMGYYNLDYEWTNPSVLATRRASADFIDEFMKNMGDCEIPLKLIHDGSDGKSYKVSGKRGNQLVIATWTKDSAVTYQTQTLAVGQN